MFSYNTNNTIRNIKLYVQFELTYKYFLFSLNGFIEDSVF